MDATLQQNILRTANPAATRVAGRSFVASDWLICIAGLGDFLAVLGGTVLALFCRQYVTFGLAKAFVPNDYINLLLFGTVTYMFLLQFNEAYSPHRFVHRMHLLKFVFKTTAHWLLGFLIISFVFQMQPMISRLYIAWAVVDSIILLIGWRMLFRHFLYVGGWASALKDRVLVVGWSKEAEALAKQIERDPEHHPYEIVGCMSSARGEYHIQPPTGINLLGEYGSLRGKLDEYKPRMLIFADPQPAAGELMHLTELCIRENVQFKLIPSFFQVFASGLHLESISGVPVLGISKLPLDQLHNRLIKRAIDIVGAIVGLCIAAPIIAAFGFLIYRESPGPIFYTQPRDGMGGRRFRIFKLRSMKLDADVALTSTSTVRTVKDDPRCLRVGKLMRRLNIDEVPQFWNVLIGDMSLVGPRPERSEDVVTLKDEIQHYNARHYALPGLSGYAQVNGMRGNTDLRERSRYDLYYLENWSLWLDFQIILKTFFVRTGAC